MEKLQETLQRLADNFERSLKDLHTDLKRSDEHISDLAKRMAKVELLLSHQSGTTRSSGALPELNVFVDSIVSERKPFLFRITGLSSGSFRASAVRAAILLVLLTDLDERLDGRSGIQNRQEAIVSAFERLDNDPSINAGESVRVALYRFKDFFDGAKITNTESYSLQYDPAGIQLNIFRGDKQLGPGEASINLTTNETEVSTVIDGISKASILRQINKRGALFVPPGPSGYDKLLVELFDHDFGIDAITAYFRPSSVSFPRDMLEMIGGSDTILHRWDLAHSGYSTGKFYYLEILNFSTTWDFIRRTDDGRFLLYPKVVQPEHVERHIEFLIHKVKTIKTYELVLSEALFPFHLGLFNLKMEPLPKSLTLFFRQISKSEPVHDISCLVISDQTVFQNMNDKVISWILGHPSTQRSKHEVAHTLAKVLDHLQSHGPLTQREPAPD